MFPRETVYFDCDNKSTGPRNQFNLQGLNTPQNLG